MTPDEYAFIERARVAALATVDGEGRPHAVPVCFALSDGSDPSREGVDPSNPDADGDGGTGTNDGNDARIVSAIDEKPKTTRALQRVRNIETNPHVTLLVDRYREDWSRLAWVQIRGRARIVEPDASVHDAAVSALEAKYDQYADHDLGDRPVVSIRIGRTVSWGALEEEPESVDDR